jgi:hypothetical protein
MMNFVALSPNSYCPVMIKAKEHYWSVGRELITVFEGNNLVGKGIDGAFTQPEGLAGSQISQELSQHHW